MIELEVPLEAWARQRWGEAAPSIFTLRAWARSGKIIPMPQKVGRTYFVKPDAEYRRDPNRSHRLIRRMSVTAAAK
jgi:predicted site-specific integrase-resolvase